MAKNLVNGNDTVIQENDNDISLELSNAYKNNLSQTINNSFKNNNIYSENEVVIGTWLNKPLYRKIINFGALPNNVAKIILHNINNVETFVTIRGIGRTSTNTAYSIPHVSNPNMFSGLSVSIRANATELTISTNADATAHTAYVIIEYTKATD